MQRNKVVPTQGKVVYYKTNGTGRDTYIHNINGGLLSHDRIHALSQYQPPKSKGLSFAKTIYGRHPSTYQRKTENKFVHYISDGSGRDFYISNNQGGSSRSYNWRDQTQFKFKNTLRASDRILQKNPQENDVFMKSQSQFTQTQSRFNRSMSSTQTFKSHQLSAPKKIPQPPAMNQYFCKGFDASKQFRKQKYGKNN